MPKKKPEAFKDDKLKKLLQEQAATQQAIKRRTQELIEEERKARNGKVYVLGGALLERAEKGDAKAQEMMDTIIAKLTRPQDRKRFGLSGKRGETVVENNQAGNL